MQNSLIVQATVVRQDQRRYEWLASALWRDCFKSFATQTYVSSTIIAIGKWGFYRHVVSVKSSPSNIVHDTHDPHVKRPFVLRSPLYHLNTILALLSPREPRLANTHAHEHKTHTANCDWGFKQLLIWLLPVLSIVSSFFVMVDS